MLVERWIDQMGKCFEILCVEKDAMKIRLGTFQLRDSAESWWRSIRGYIRYDLGGFLPVVLRAAFSISYQRP